MQHVWPIPQSTPNNEDEQSWSKKMNSSLNYTLVGSPTFVDPYKHETISRTHSVQVSCQYSGNSSAAAAIEIVRLCHQVIAGGSASKISAKAFASASCTAWWRFPSESSFVAFHLNSLTLCPVHDAGWFRSPRLWSGGFHSIRSQPNFPYCICCEGWQLNGSKCRPMFRSNHWRRLNLEFEEVATLKDRSGASAFSRVPRSQCAGAVCSCAGSIPMLISYPHR